MPDVELKEVVKKRYGDIAEGAAGCGSLCGCVENAESLAISFGYTHEDLANLPPGTNLGLSCGNPQSLADLRPGETVLDLGSGAGFDALLAAKKVYPGGRVIGVDMTEAMLAKARANARSLGCTNVEFRPGDIEQLPVEGNSIDVVLSNCVLNLCTNKDRAFSEIFRVLKPSGRLCISDMAWKHEPSQAIRRDLEAVVGCIGGALVLSDYVQRLRQAGFRDMLVEEHAEAARAMIELSGVPPREEYESLLSVTITALKSANQIT
jgi:ubiquinone/menaquinone biosynthesis C-methylase UbiE